ncbi:MAG TPA: VOC family protein [Albitalea sp.]|uniref:VOC family protein n=1 Tax=Piscinibacter sp. TaxID=1903157 RepID=UPI002ED619C8
MYDHVGLKVRDLAAAGEFYRRALAPLGHVPASAGDGYAGFGPKGEPALWLYEHAGGPGAGTHVALRAPSREAVQRFHAEGLAAGGRDNGGPGLRTEYSASYYAAFLIDPDGHNVEAVCFV